MKDDIFFSVIIPVYNRANVISNAINSVLLQKHRSFELIVVDNCSTDGTISAIEAINDHRIILIRNPQNIGLWPNHTKAVAYASSDWIVFLHSDEELLPDALGEMADMLGNLNENERRRVGLMAGISSKSPISFYSKSKAFSCFQEYPQTVLTVLNGISQPSGICVNKEAFYAVGGISSDRGFHTFADHLLYLNLALMSYCFCFISKEMTTWVGHADRDTNNWSASQMTGTLRRFSNELAISGKTDQIAKTLSDQITEISDVVTFKIVLALVAGGNRSISVWQFMKWLIRLSFKQRLLLIKHFFIGRFECMSGRLGRNVPQGAI